MSQILKECWRMKKTFALLLVLAISVAMLAGCNGAEKTDAPAAGASVTGKYTIVSMEAEGMDMLALFQAMGASIDGIYLELLADGTFKLVMEIEIMGETQSDIQEGTYKVDGTTITLTVDEEDVTATIDGAKITMEQAGAKLVFEKK